MTAGVPVSLWLTGDATEADLLPGVRLAGSVTFVEESLAPEAQALVY